MKIQQIIILILLMVAPLTISGQSLNDAKKLYQENNYAEAKLILENLYTSTPNNAEVNNLLGIILFQEGQYIKSKNLLEFASQKRVTESYIYLGNIYSLLYMFDKAEKEFTKYERANRRNKDALENLDIQRDYASKLQRMISRTEDVQIIDSVIVNKDNFLSAYKLSASNGSLQPISQFFKNDITNNKVLFTNERKDKIYYSIDNATNGSKLYSMERLLDDFGNEKPLFGSTNQSGEQAYPFVLTDGVTIYFASTGEESIGGYDLFITRYNYNTNTYLAPSQLNMPFNSPFNDYMMVIDDEKGIGWFASDRFQPNGLVCVYTFIPSSRVVLIDSDDEKYIADRAMITSIKDSWIADKDYSSILDLAKQDNIIETESSGDFEFIVDDRITYRSLSDFKHGSARTLFSQSLDLDTRLKQMISELNEQREQFTNGSQSQSVRSYILKLESDIRSIYQEVESLKIRARNEEIRNTF